MTATEYVILVDKHDQEIGLTEKLAAHQQNLLHRAFSIFLFRSINNEKELLLQQRAAQKYHSAGLWTNTCCSHPRPGEDILLAGKRRLQEECGIKADLKNVGWFHYNAHFDNGLAENEIDHVLIGWVKHNILLQPNKDEIQATRWIPIETLQQELKAHPEQFTPWFEEALAIAIKD